MRPTPALRSRYGATPVRQLLIDRPIVLLASERTRPIAMMLSVGPPSERRRERAERQAEEAAAAGEDARHAG